MKTAPVITLNEICKSYGSRIILDHFSCAFFPGRLYMITGCSGRGKSTLLHLIGLLDQSFEGDYYLDHTNVRSLKESRKDRLRNRYFGFVFQNYHLIPEMNVTDNILLPCLYSGKPSYSAFLKKCSYLRSLLSLNGLTGKDIRMLSGGEQQRIAVARALIMDPQVILADEPTGNLDPENTKIILDFFRTLTENGKTILMVTHDTSLLRYADETIPLK